MRHGVDGRKFGRNTSHRKAMFRNIAIAAITQEQIVTTVEKAKEVRRVIDRWITLGKNGDLASRRLAFDRSRDRAVVTKLFGELAERYKARQGGYTRVLKLAELRRGDAAHMAILELVDHPVIDRKKKTKAMEASENEAAAEAAAPVDPFARFRKVFGAGKKADKAGKTANTGTKEAKGTKKKAGAKRDA